MTRIDSGDSARDRDEQDSNQGRATEGTGDGGDAQSSGGASTATDPNAAPPSKPKEKDL